VDNVNQEPTHEQIYRLAQALLAPADTAACTACLDELETYITSQLSGDDYRVRWPMVAQHLDSCVDCAESYALLYRVRLAEHSLPQPVQVPTADLSFLQAGAAGPLAPAELRAIQYARRLHSALGAAVERSGARLRLTLSRALLDLLAARPAPPALAFRSGDEQALIELALNEPNAEVALLQLSAYADPAPSEHCTVRIQLALHDRAWPDLAGVQVALLTQDEHRQATTDAWGEATFADVPLAALPVLQIEIDAGG
jgi:hypothetical protein